LFHKPSAHSLQFFVPAPQHFSVHVKLGDGRFQFRPSPFKLRSLAGQLADPLFARFLPGENVRFLLGQPAPLLFQPAPLRLKLGGVLMNALLSHRHRLHGFARRTLDSLRVRRLCTCLFVQVGIHGHIPNEARWPIDRQNAPSRKRHEDPPRQVPNTGERCGGYRYHSDRPPEDYDTVLGGWNCHSKWSSFSTAACIPLHGFSVVRASTDPAPTLPPVAGFFVSRAARLQ